MGVTSVRYRIVTDGGRGRIILDDIDMLIRHVRARGWHLDGIYENSGTPTRASGSSRREGANRSDMVGGGPLRHVPGEEVASQEEARPLWLTTSCGTLQNRAPCLKTGYIVAR